MKRQETRRVAGTSPTRREGPQDVWLAYLDELERKGWVRGEQNCPQFGWFLQSGRNLEHKKDYLERTKEW
jgi:hypothetical protein